MTKSKRRLDMGEEAWAEYQRQRKNRKSDYWKKKNAIYVVNYRRRAKMLLIEYKGGKCEICGQEDLSPAAFDFHHVDPNQKYFEISKKMHSGFEKLKREADKCQLVCKNCHADIHDPLTREEQKAELDRYKRWCKDRSLR